VIQAASAQHLFSLSTNMSSATGVKGTGGIISQADEGMKLFAKDPIITFDSEGAANFKKVHEASIQEIESKSEKLTGKANKNARSELGKQVQSMKAEAKYIDACKVVKGLEAPNGNFMTKVTQEPAEQSSGYSQAPVAPTAPKKAESKKKEAETGGLSKAEKDELEKLKDDIVARKTELKEQGMSGGQCNKDEQVQKWVARMQELKIKENPLGLADDGKKNDDKKKEKKPSSGEKLELEKKIEEYKSSLRNDFGYSEKDIKADPDFQELQKEYAKMK